MAGLQTKVAAAKSLGVGDPIYLVQRKDHGRAHVYVPSTSGINTQKTSASGPKDGFVISLRLMYGAVRYLNFFMIIVNDSFSISFWDTLYMLYIN